MKMMKRLLALVMMLAICCTLTACKKEEPVTDATTPVSAETVTAGNPDDVLVTVGEEKITRGEYEDYLTTLNTFYTNYGYDVTDPSITAMLKQFALQTGIEYAVMDQKIAEMNLALTEDEKTAALADAQNVAETLYSARDVEGVLSEMGFTASHGAWSLDRGDYSLYVSGEAEPAEAGELWAGSVSAFYKLRDPDAPRQQDERLFSLACTRYKEVAEP